MQPREGGGGRRFFLPSRADRYMLNGISANLEHLRRPSKPNSQPLANGDLGHGKGETVQNGVGAKGGNGRLDYNRKAMHEIGQSLKDYHIDAHQPQVLPGTNGCNETDALIRQWTLLGYDEEMIRHGITLCASKNKDKILEVVQSLSNRETKNSPSSLLGLPGYPNKVIRKPSFEEKYRTTSPTTLNNVPNSVENPPNNDSMHHYAESNVNSSYINQIPSQINAVRLIFDDVGQGNDGAVHHGRYCTPYGVSGQPNGHVTNVRGKTPVLRPVPGGTSVSRNGSPGTVMSSSSGSSPQAIVPPNVRQLTQTFNQMSVSNQSHNFLMTDFLSWSPDEISPLSSHSPSPASTPSSGFAQSVPDGMAFARPSHATVLNTRQNFPKHLCNSKEVERPVPQKATVPPNPRIQAAAAAAPAAVVAAAVNMDKHMNDFPVPKKLNNYPNPYKDNQTDPNFSAMSVNYDHQNFTLAESHRVAPAPVFYKQPFTQQKLINEASMNVNVENNGYVTTSNALSEYTITVQQPSSADIPERPPPPYPGRDADIYLVSRPYSTVHEAVLPGRTFIQLNKDCDDGMQSIYNGGVGYTASEQYAESTDGSSQTDTDSAAVETQLIESPKPVRKADACKKDAERSETQVRHYPPQAYRFYMEQHMENVFKFRKERLDRRIQLEREMSQVNLPPESQASIRKLLIQKESNYLRQRRAKIDKSMFQRLKTLGTGAFGEVDLVLKKDTSKLYALKTLQKKDVLKRNQVAHVKAERDILAEADNEWVVKMYYSFQDSANLYIVMDYIPGGDMMGLLIKLGIFEGPLAQFYVAELVLAIESVHAMGFIHRDIKPDNILIGKDGHIKLTDFGLCTGFRWTHNSKYYQKGNHPRQDSMDPDENWGAENCQCEKEILKPMERRKLKHQRCLAHSLVGTPNYIAPEVLCKSGYTACCDWWSVGVILYEMRVGTPPFYAHTPVETQMKVIHWPTTLSIPTEAELSPETTDLILRLCCGPEERLGKNGSSEVKSHPFFSGINFETLRQQEAPYIPPLRCSTDTSNFDPVDPEKLRRSASIDSLLKEENYDGGKHAFLEFTFRRFFDDDGHVHATRMHDPETGSAVFV